MTETEPILVEALAGVKMIDIAAGGWHSAAVSVFGDLYTWGWNVNGQIGMKLEQSGSSVFSLPQLIEIIDGDGEEMSIKEVSCGSRHTVVKTETTGRFFATGWNRDGQCGLPKCDNDTKNSFNLHDNVWDQFTEINFEFKGDYTAICGNWATLFKLNE